MAIEHRIYNDQPRALPYSEGELPGRGRYTVLPKALIEADSNIQTYLRKSLCRHVEFDKSPAKPVISEEPTTKTDTDTPSAQEGSSEESGTDTASGDSPKKTTTRKVKPKPRKG